MDATTVASPPELLDAARSLINLEEASQELLTCARYGETDACRAILDIWQVGPDALLVNTSDPLTLNTPLHYAAANNHLDTVELLLSRGSLWTANDHGNSPLHWAAAAGCSAICRVLLEHFDRVPDKHEDDSTVLRLTQEQQQKQRKVYSMDVLLKNKFGRSALTEAFASGSTETVEVLLNHHSAEEEKLIGGLSNSNTNEVDNLPNEEEEECNERNTSLKNHMNDKNGVIHEFDFLNVTNEHGIEEECSVISHSISRPSVRIRELPILNPDNPFGESSLQDTTGLSIWSASLVMARWLTSPPMRKRLHQKSVLELGAGCGVPSLAVATYSSPKSVIATDLNPITVENLQYNIELNFQSSSSMAQCQLHAQTIDWADESTYPTETVDFVICSDCIYDKNIVPLLIKVLMGILKRSGDNEKDSINCTSRRENVGSFLYVAPEGGRDGLPEFILEMKYHGFECIHQEPAPKMFKDNPLKSKDDEDCFVHFHELASSDYVLYEFK